MDPFLVTNGAHLPPFVSSVLDRYGGKFFASCSTEGFVDQDASSEAGWLVQGLIIQQLIVLVQHIFLRLRLQSHMKERIPFHLFIPRIRHFRTELVTHTTEAIIRWVHR